MADSNEKACELNEVSWWSYWTQTRWLGQNAYVMLSQDFDEYFFNRGGFLQITPDVKKSIEPMEAQFEARKRKPHLFLQSDQLDQRLLLLLAKRGYRIADQMSVMEMDEPNFSLNAGLKIEAVGESRLGDWARVYQDAFYGDQSQAEGVLAAVRKLSQAKEASLLLGTVKDEPVGVVGLLRTGKVCGVYCVGTHSGWRGKRVASTMLEHSHRLAVKEGSRLILQTILSDSVEGLYTKLGFKRAYLKDLFVKDARLKGK